MGNAEFYTDLVLVVGAHKEPGDFEPQELVDAFMDKHVAQYSWDQMVPLLSRGLGDVGEWNTPRILPRGLPYYMVQQGAAIVLREGQARGLPLTGALEGVKRLLIGQFHRESEIYWPCFYELFRHIAHEPVIREHYATILAQSQPAIEQEFATALILYPQGWYERLSTYMARGLLAPFSVYQVYKYACTPEHYAQIKDWPEFILQGPEELQDVLFSRAPLLSNADRATLAAKGSYALRSSIFSTLTR